MSREYVLNIAIAGIIDGHVSGVITILVMIMLISVFMITIAHKIFGLVTWLPDNAMRWMGQAVQNMGESGEKVILISSV